ncbi:transposase [Arthrobacter rhombi]|uniref:transposase n=1 Tax=Arthrobacter rhombi TaxID=71253 RepID=UPI003FD4ADB7
MTASSKKNYDPAFREESVRLVLGSDRSVNQVATEIGVKPSTLGNWVRRYRLANPETTGTAQAKGPVPWVEHQKTLAENAKLKAEVEFLGYPDRLVMRMSA